MAELEPIDYETPLGMVRLYTTDTSEDPAARLLTDDQIRGLLTAASDSVYGATARALRLIATSEVLVSKKIRTQDLQTDGPAVAAELRAQAREYDDMAAVEDGDVSFAGYVPPVPGRGYEAEEARWPAW